MGSSKTLILVIVAVVVAAVVQQLLMPLKSPVADIGYGKQEGNVFSHEYFGLEVPLPDGWFIQGAEKRQEYIDKGSEMLSKNSDELKRSVESSKKSTLNLLTAFEHDPQIPAPTGNMGIMCMAEKVSHIPGLNKSEDYIDNLKKVYRMGKINAIFVGQPKEVMICGKKFLAQDTQLNVGPTFVSQRYIVRISKGYALAFVLSYLTEDQEKQLTRILESVTVGE
ncbi:MAG: hypothetical protein JXR97_04905 [Planctomycetes bacterium]|nr:hypothetical protein [Planctomycetota bacterium]